MWARFLYIVLYNASLTYTLAHIHERTTKNAEIFAISVHTCMLALSCCMLCFVLQFSNRAAQCALPTSFRALLPIFRLSPVRMVHKSTDCQCVRTQEIQMRAIRCSNSHRDFREGRGICDI